MGSEDQNSGLHACAVRAVLTKSSPWSPVIAVLALKLLEVAGLSVGVCIVSSPLGGTQGGTILNQRLGLWDGLLFVCLFLFCFGFGFSRDSY